MQPELLAKRIRANLLEQKNKLETYLKIIDSEGKDIADQDADKLLAHINVEKEVIDELSRLKVILEPLEVMYNTSPYKKDSSLAGLKSCIERLSGDVIEKSKINRDHLDTVLSNLKSNIKSVKSKSGYTNKVYAQAGSGLLDING